MWHWHKYEPVAVDYIPWASSIGGLPAGGFDRAVQCTIVLYACRCGKVRTKKLPGQWMLEQIQRREKP
jgi:hypothetical protein